MRGGLAVPCVCVSRECSVVDVIEAVVGCFDSEMKGDEGMRKMYL